VLRTDFFDNDVNDYPHGPVVKVILYHPSLLKIEVDFPNVISVQEIPCNRFFDFEPSSMALGAELQPIPELWRIGRNYF